MAGFSLTMAGLLLNLFSCFGENTHPVFRTLFSPLGDILFGLGLIIQFYRRSNSPAQKRGWIAWGLDENDQIVWGLDKDDPKKGMKIVILGCGLLLILFGLWRIAIHLSSHPGLLAGR